ncbi:hypothetical protein Cgig2_029545 [Carnegiea gigantea]|uniref:SNARE associated Golgi protein n=1 Tax=Carnegiea gigantea TaxID=171969 RepID=A0A9Q1KLX0_9CARY|nr:hypothetical protein Cgig2_029545 [Carnegiea gigantea]
MVAPRIVIGDEVRFVDLESADAKLADSPTGKKAKWEGRFPLARSELMAAVSVFLVFSIGLFCIFLRMPGAEYGKIKLPRTISDLRLLKDNLAIYANDHPAQFILGYCSTYIFMQTFMIPGTIFMSLLAGALFGVIRGLLLVVFNATAGASSCYFLSKLIGKPIVNWLWPEKLRFFQAEVSTLKMHKVSVVHDDYILMSLGIDISFGVFVLTFFCLFNNQAGLALGELKSVKDLYDFKTLTVLFAIGAVIIFPTLLKRKRTYE